jgi:magnesium transporter
MITAYTPTGAHPLNAGQALPAGTVWVDANDCNESEVQALAQITHLTLPPLKDLRLLEQAHQSSIQKGVATLMVPTILGSQSDSPQNEVMLFVLSPNLLVTVHHGESRAITNFAREKSAARLLNAETAFVGLLGALAARMADLSEIISHEMEQVSKIVFQESLQRSKALGRGKDTSWRRVLQGLGRTARLNHKLHTALSGLDRLLIFISSRELLSDNAKLIITPLQRDVHGLIKHVDFMVNESTFLLDAIVGAISIEQNSVIKIFSMMAVILMPPTMIASIYGMNFKHMPELAEPWAYPAALLLLLFSALVPWVWFKRQGWF